jgi:hypothetical protein
MAFVTGYDPQAGNKQLMKNIGKLVSTTLEVGGAIAGAQFGPMFGAIGSQVGRGIGSAVTGQESAISGNVGSALGYMMGEKFGGKPGIDRKKLGGLSIEGRLGGDMKTDAFVSGGQYQGNTIDLYSRMLKPIDYSRLGQGQTVRRAPGTP